MTPMTPLTPLGAPDDIVIFTQPRRENYQRQVTMTCTFLDIPNTNFDKDKKDRKERTE